MKETKLFFFSYQKEQSFDPERKVYFDSQKELENIVDSLEKRENLFELIPELNKANFKNQGLSYGYFQISSVIYDGRYSYSKESCRSVGRILVPYYNIITRKKLREIEKDNDVLYVESKNYLKTMEKNPSRHIFFRLNDKYLCLHKKNVLVLSKKQL